MDISKEYIEMRIKAIPFLGKGETPRISDTLIVYYDEYSVRNDAFGFFFVQSNADIKNYICVLDRQDQLQNMLYPENIIIHASDLIYMFNDFCRKLEIWSNFSSMEQFWLAFVMHERFNKIWNGKDWA